MGLTTAQHQLLVAIKGHPEPEPPAIRELADYLLRQSHSAVGLVAGRKLAVSPGGGRTAKMREWCGWSSPCRK